MTPLLKHVLALLLVSSFVLPLVAGCGKSEKAMQDTSGLSNRDKRDKAQGLSPGT